MKMNLNRIVNSAEAARPTVRRLMLVACLSIMSVCAFATDPDPLDYTTAITSFKTDLADVLTTNGPTLMGALVVALGFGIVWKLIKRAAKSV